MKSTLFLLAFFFFFPAHPPIQEDDLQQRTVVVIITDANGSLVVGRPMELSIRKPLSRTQCTTDENGRCEMVFGSNEELINGVLLVVGAGRQSVLFKGPSVEINIKLNESGLLDIPLDVHSEAPEEQPTAEVAEPTQVIEPTAIPTQPEQPAEEPAAEAEPASGQIIEPTAAATLAVPTAEISAEEVEFAPASPETQGRSFAWIWWLLAIVLVGLAGLGGWMMQKGGRL